MMNTKALMTLKKTLLLLAACIFLLPAALAAQKITGTVTNQTTGKAAAGDDVVLIKLANGMQEANRTKTDTRGRYSLPLDDAGMHLVRVTHENVPYFHAAPPGTKTADIDVYDSSEKVAGITGVADAMRMQASDNSLEVTELYVLQNDSEPKRTQFGTRAFELYLPTQAQLTAGAALGPPLSSPSAPARPVSRSPTNFLTMASWRSLPKSPSPCRTSPSCCPRA
jgi:hypothetical protein